MGGSHTFNVDNRVLNITKIKQDGTSKPIIKSIDSGWNYIQHIMKQDYKFKHICWNSNSNTLDFLWTPIVQQARWLSF